MKRKLFIVLILMLFAGTASAAQSYGKYGGKWVDAVAEAVIQRLRGNFEVGTTTNPADVNVRILSTGTVEVVRLVFADGTFMTTITSLSTTTFTGDIILDDGVTDSPMVKFINGGNDESVIYVDATGRLAILNKVTGSNGDIWLQAGNDIDDYFHVRTISNEPRLYVAGASFSAYLVYNDTLDKWQFVDNGVNAYNFDHSSFPVTAQFPGTLGATGKITGSAGFEVIDGTATKSFTVEQLYFEDGTSQTTAGGGGGSATVFEEIIFSIDGTIGKDTFPKGQAPYYISTTTGVIDSIMVSLSTDTISGLLWVNLEVSTDDGHNWTPVCSSSVTVEAGERSSNTSSINYLIDINNDDVDRGDKVRLRVGNVPVGAKDLSVTARKKLD